MRVVQGRYSRLESLVNTADEVLKNCLDYDLNASGNLGVSIMWAMIRRRSAVGSADISVTCLMLNQGLERRSMRNCSIMVR
jgi:hypothetical protein